MKNRTIRLLSLVLALIMVVAISACKKSTSKSSTSAASGASAKVSTAKASGSTAKASGSTARASGSTVADNSEGGSTGPVATDSEGNPVQTPDPGTGGTGYQPKEWNVNLNGQEVLMQSRRIVNNMAKYTEEDYDLTPEQAKAKYTSTSSLRDYIYAKNLHDSAEKYNFVINWNYDSNKGVGDMANAFRLNVMAGVFWADVIELISSFIVPEVVNKGFILPIDPYIDYSTDPNLASDWMQTSTLWKGQHYGIVRPGPGNMAIAFNLDLFNQLGLADPNALYRANNWTWASFTEIAKQGTQDLNSDGVMDIWGFAADGDTSAGMFAAESNGTVNVILDTRTSYATFGLNSQKGIRALQFLSQLANIDKVMDYTKGRADYYQGKVCMIAGNTNISTEVISKNYFRNGFAPFPIGPDADRVNVYRTDVSYFVFPINTRYREIIPIIAYAEVMWDPNAPLFVPITNLAGGSTGKFSRPEDEQLWLELMTSPKLNYASSMGQVGADIGTKVITPVLRNLSTPQAALSSQASAIQAALDMWFSQ